MRTPVLHRRIIQDVELMFDALNEVIPSKMPPRYETRDMNLGSFIKRLNTITEAFNILNEISDDNEIRVGEIVTSGVWLPEDWLPEHGSHADVRVLWHSAPSVRRIRMTPKKWQQRRYYFWERLIHELIHRHQCVFRPEDTLTKTFHVYIDDKKIHDEQQYYSDYDELEAYAYDAALEMVTWWPECNLQDAIHNAMALNGTVCSTYDQYMSSFERGHVVRKHFRRKLKSWFNTIRQAPDFYVKLALPKLV